METTGRVHVNQIGYGVSDGKRFVVSGNGGAFTVHEAAGGSSVFSGRTQAATDDQASGGPAAAGDFSEVRRPGRYYVSVEGLGRSHEFEISDEPYSDVLRGLLKSFYYQRCGTELPEQLAGPWKHGACHMDEGTVYGESSKRLPSHGGWHDAGDYGKYTVAAAKAVADLFLAYEYFPGAFEAATGIPESGNDVPDVLNEARYELEWMLRMQRSEDGAVYHKLTTKQFPGLDVMPEDDTAELVFSPVSATSAGTFAAIMAYSASVYARYDAEFAATCRDAAIRAWKWLIAGDNREIRFVNPPDIVTGEYGDRTVADELYWAAAELFRLTGEDAYHRFVRNGAEEGSFPLYPLGWADVGGYGTLAYLRTDKGKTDAALYERLLSGWLEQADRYAQIARQDGFGISLPPDQYIWGSNMVVMNNAMHLILASLLSGRAEYRDSALDHLHYLLGMNVMDLSYVTGFGTNAVRLPHHRPSVGDGVDDPVPGMVAGGPNKNLQDPISKQKLQGLPPAKCFIDHEDSYATNEMTVYWNSPAVFVAASF